MSPLYLATRQLCRRHGMLAAERSRLNDIIILLLRYGAIDNHKVYQQNTVR